MKRVVRGKRGLELSFSMIFSIILIIAIVGVAFYVISNFLGLQTCTVQSIFYQDLQDAVDRAWNSEITRENFEGSVPRGIERVCFGSVDSQVVDPRYDEEHELFRRYFRAEANMFLHPPEKACNPEYLELEHVDLTALGGFTCIEVENGKIEIKLEKGSFDSLVKLGRA